MCLEIHIFVFGDEIPIWKEVYFPVDGYRSMPSAEKLLALFKVLLSLRKEQIAAVAAKARY